MSYLLLVILSVPDALPRFGCILGRIFYNLVNVLSIGFDFMRLCKEHGFELRLNFVNGSNSRVASLKPPSSPASNLIASPMVSRRVKLHELTIG